MGEKKLRKIEEEILEKDEPFIKATVKAYIHNKFPSGKPPAVFDEDDMCQEAFIAYWNAIRHYDGTTSQLKTYGTHAIINALHKSYRLYKDTQMQDCLEDMPESKTGVDNELLTALEGDMWVASIANELKEKKNGTKYMEIGINSILEMGAYGTRQTEIADRHGTSKEYINKCISKTREIIKKDEELLRLVKAT